MEPSAKLEPAAVVPTCWFPSFRRSPHSVPDDFASGFFGAEFSRTWIAMPQFNNANFSERKSASANAKAALVEKLRAKPPADDPATLAKRAERQAILEARQRREAEREAQRREREAREAEERAAQAAAEAAAAAERERQLEAERAAAEEARLQRAAKIIADEAARKAARDARYAARKARR